MELQKVTITEFRFTLAISRKCLILNVDQPGLEPGTSRL